MTQRMAPLLLAFIALPAAGSALSQNTPSPARYTPTAHYPVQQIRGFTVRVHPVLEQFPGQRREALDLLQQKLEELERLLPASRLGRLRAVPFWLEWESRPGGAAEYHVSQDWLRENGYNPDKVRGVEISNARNFVSWTHLSQPMMVLHELAHAYHHQHLGYDHPGVREAFAAARRDGRYESVLDFRGGKRRAYALTNDREYFAEVTEAYFGRNDFQPFDREELRQFDPAGYALAERVWRAPE